MGNDFKDLFGDGRPDEDGKQPQEGLPMEHESRGNLPLNEKEVKVVNVFEGMIEPAVGTSGKPATTTFVLLQDNLGRSFRIFVLRDMAVAISMALNTDIPDRPFTHDLFKIILDKIGARIERITIDDLWQETFYAKITLVKPDGQTVDIDSRPSDALALALRYRAPIYAAEAVLEEANRQNE